jgi:light-harvesting protein B-800-850 alpha chain
MNQSRIWLVVHPTVGLPLFLGSVATISLIVHAAILSNTAWYPAFMQGGFKGKAAALQPEQSPATKSAAQLFGGQAAKVVFDAEVTPSRVGTVVFADGTTARISMERPDTQSRSAIIRFEDGRTAKVLMDDTAQPRLVSAGVRVEPGTAK